MTQDLSCGAAGSDQGERRDRPAEVSLPADERSLPSTPRQHPPRTGDLVLGARAERVERRQRLIGGGQAGAFAVAGRREATVLALLTLEPADQGTGPPRQVRVVGRRRGVGTAQVRPTPDDVLRARPSVNRQRIRPDTHPRTSDASAPPILSPRRNRIAATVALPVSRAFT